MNPPLKIAQATYWTRFDPAVRPMSSLDSKNDLQPDEVKINGAEGFTPLDEAKNLFSELTNGKGAAGEVARETGDFVVRNKSIEIILEEPKKVTILSPLDAKGEYELDHPLGRFEISVCIFAVLLVDSSLQRCLALELRALLE